MFFIDMYFDNSREMNVVIDKNILMMTETMYAMRSFLPLWVGLLTFINPWMILIVNKDVRGLVLFHHVATKATTIAYKNNSIIHTSKK
uniref:7TM_GPCR_Srx domain-containing protein n=1 Tax=Heterorhabditis bacteriophora TaxID=37862 RepID=A0A1I7XFR2_HETBA